jgi:hypothetical protein
MADLTRGEIENYVEHLRNFPVEEIGSFAWIQQLINIERLNVCAHHQAANNQFEQVVDSISTLEKFEVLVHELLAAELWMKHCLSGIKGRIPHLAFARVFMLERSLTTIMNLLELVVFRPENLSVEGCLPLVDFCNRRMAALSDADLSDLIQEDPPEEVRTKFSLGFSGLSIIWCLASCPELSLSVTKRLVAEDDVVITICALLMRQPWRTVKRGKISKWFNGEIKELKAAEAMRICPPEAHAWTALQQLLEPRCLEMSRWNEHRRQAVLGVEAMMSEVLFDQLPPLQSLSRAIQWLKMNEAPQSKFTAVIEQYPMMLIEFEKKRDWKAVAEASFQKYFNAPPQQLQKELMELSEFFEIFQ